MCLYIECITREILENSSLIADSSCQLLLFQEMRDNRQRSPGKTISARLSKSMTVGFGIDGYSRLTVYLKCASKQGS